MFIVKIIFFVILFGLIVSSEFFQSILTKMGTTANSINDNFFKFLAVEVRIFFLLALLALVFGLVYAFKK